MGNFSDDTQKDDFMNASAEEWSKPTPPAQRPPAQSEPADRWGSPITDKTASSSPTRWGSETQSHPGGTTPAKARSGSKWWIILIVVLVVLCLCACLVAVVLPLLGLPALGWNLFQSGFEFIP
jgi:hypothetical protein